MSLARTLKKLILGETWTLPLGIATVVLVAALVVRPLLGHDAWRHAGGYVLLAGIVAVLLLSVSTSGGARR
jgi:branched-subunit amino acid transport protein